MKLHYAALTLAWMSEQAFAAKPTAGEDSVFRPQKFAFDDIANGKAQDNESLLSALQDVGIISVTKMSDSFRSSKKESLAWTHRCAVESEITKVHEFPDGTRRRTMATHTIPGPGGIQKIGHGGASSACQAFDEASLPFREGVDSVTKAFAVRVTKLLEGEMNSTPLLQTEDGFDFKTAADVVENGEHLEHFHSYQGTSKAALRKTDDSTIEWHTDQGMFLVFTPGVMVEQTGDMPAVDAFDETEGFYVELADGTRTLVKFDHEDDLVIMLGDGVNQYLNANLKSGGSGRKLRAVPHAVAMPIHEDNESRVWYGRMVLPPASAIHPEHGETFAKLRKLMVEGGGDSKEVMALGCSSPSMHARQLEETSCEEGTLFCWHRCMPLDSETPVSDEICAEQGLDLRCANPRGQLWDNTHGDWYPACLDASSAPNATAFDPLPDFPRDNETCTAVAYKTFVEKNAEEYDFKADLMEGGSLLWSVEGKNIKGMLAYNGLFGYTSLGFRGFPGSGNAMYGAIVIMATPSDAYSPVTGFDPDGEPAVEEYIIDATDKAFRHWMTPVTATARVASAVNSYQVQETDCFTAMTFNTPGIFNTTFNITGTDELIWGANGEDIFAGYHGQSRGVITVEWAAGKVTLDEKREALKAEMAGDHEGHDHDGDDHSETNPLDDSAASSTGFFVTLFASMLAVFWM